jgi:hypothetical protein
VAVFEGLVCDPLGDEVGCAAVNAKSAAVVVELVGDAPYLIVFYTDGEWWPMTDPEITITNVPAPPPGYGCDDPATVTSDNHFIGGLGEDCWSWTADASHTVNEHTFTCDAWVGGDVVVEHTTGASQSLLSFDVSISNTQDANGYVAFEVTGSSCETGESAYCTATFGLADVTDVIGVSPSTTYYFWVADAYMGHHLPDVDLCLWEP